jgi:hypothetical protein
MIFIKYMEGPIWPKVSFQKFGDIGQKSRFGKLNLEILRLSAIWALA